MGSTGVSTEQQAFSGPPKMERYPRSGLDVLVVGGGLAGLTFAIEAFRKGHEVLLIDRRPHFDDYGRPMPTRVTEWRTVIDFDRRRLDCHPGICLADGQGLA